MSHPLTSPSTSPTATTTRPTPFTVAVDELTHLAEHTDSVTQQTTNGDLVGLTTNQEHTLTTLLSSCLDRLEPCLYEASRHGFTDLHDTLSIVEQQLQGAKTTLADATHTHDPAETTALLTDFQTTITHAHTELQTQVTHTDYQTDCQSTMEWATYCETTDTTITVPGNCRICGKVYKKHASVDTIANADTGETVVTR